MEYTIISVISIIIGPLISFFIFNNKKESNKNIYNSYFQGQIEEILPHNKYKMVR